MLEQIFNSKTRVKILTLFLQNTDKSFYVRETTRLVGDYVNSVRRELFNLSAFGLLKVKEIEQKHYYKLDKKFFLYPEIKKLFLKSQVFLENDLTNSLKKIGEVDLLIFTGAFTDAVTRTDLLLVGDKIDKKKITEVLNQFGNILGRDIRFTLLTRDEYNWRQTVSDSFLHEILKNKNIVLIDKLNNK